MGIAIPLRRVRLAASMAAAQAAAPAGDQALQVTALDVFAVKEPDSGRSYAVIRLTTRNGLKGYGECAIPTESSVAAARAAITGKPATAYEVAAAALHMHPGISAGVNIALLDLAGKQAKVPIFQLLGGPTRTKARALAPLSGSSADQLARSLTAAQSAGFRAFSVPVIPPTPTKRSKEYVESITTLMADLRKRAGEGSDFVLDGSIGLLAADAANLATALERFHLLWFDEPVRLSNLSIAQRIASENVTPLGFGRFADGAGLFQDLLRDGAVDILRPSLALHGISGIRRIATMAENYYVAVGPYHNGGPVGTAAALQLAASLPNFFIQEIPLPASSKDREMRSAIAGGWKETVRDGFAPLPNSPGLGIEVNERALQQFRGGVA